MKAKYRFPASAGSVNRKLLLISIKSHQKLLSYLFPVQLRKTGKGDSFTELLIFNGRLQLGTADAMYSDGSKYMPAITVREYFRQFLPQVKSVLVLGGGMASMVHVLHEKGFHPQFTIVEVNKTILQWAMEFTPAHMLSHIEPVCEDAANFIRVNTRQYDLVFIDVFIGRTVPAFVVSELFLQQCRRAMVPGGHLALNYIINNPTDWQAALKSFNSVFPVHSVADRGENRIFLV